MRFTDWLTTAKIPLSNIAKELGVSYETVRRWRSGERFPDKDIQARIFQMSCGHVTPNDWVGVGPRDAIDTSLPPAQDPAA